MATAVGTIGSIRWQKKAAPWARGEGCCPQEGLLADYRRLVPETGKTSSSCSPPLSPPFKRKLLLPPGLVRPSLEATSLGTLLSVTPWLEDRELKAARRKRRKF